MLRSRCPQNPFPSTAPHLGRMQGWASWAFHIQWPGSLRHGGTATKSWWIYQALNVHEWVLYTFIIVIITIKPWLLVVLIILIIILMILLSCVWSWLISIVIANSVIELSLITESLLSILSTLSLLRGLWLLVSVVILVSWQSKLSSVTTSHHDYHYYRYHHDDLSLLSLLSIFSISSLSIIITIIIILANHSTINHHLPWY